MEINFSPVFGIAITVLLKKMKQHVCKQALSMVHCNLISILFVTLLVGILIGISKGKWW